VKILHLLRTADDIRASRTIMTFERLGAEQTLVMVQDGVYSQVLDFPAYACAEDVSARGIDVALELIDYDRIVEMIFEHDRVITW
jgi:sulfur relay protein TusB/DsrH